MDISAFSDGAHTMSFTPIAKHGRASLYCFEGTRRNAEFLCEVPIVGWAVVVHIEEGETPFTSVEPVFFYRGDAWPMTEAASNGLLLRDIDLP